MPPAIVRAVEARPRGAARRRSAWRPGRPCTSSRRSRMPSRRSAGFRVFWPVPSAPAAPSCPAAPRAPVAPVAPLAPDHAPVAPGCAGPAPATASRFELRDEGACRDGSRRSCRDGCRGSADRAVGDLRATVMKAGEPWRVVPVAASAQIAPTAIVLVLFMLVPSVRVCGCRGAFCGTADQTGIGEREWRVKRVFATRTSTRRVARPRCRTREVESCSSSRARACDTTGSLAIGTGTRERPMVVGRSVTPGVGLEPTTLRLTAECSAD